jgi:hypothetical protein
MTPIGLATARDGMKKFIFEQMLPDDKVAILSRWIQMGAPWPQTADEGPLADELKAFGGERLLTIGRCAILTQNHRGRLACHYCGPCEKGCITNSNQTASRSPSCVPVR